MGKEYTENDWKLFRSKVPGWQEAYMDKFNHEYVFVLSDDGVSASEKFWPVRKKDDQHHSNVVIIMNRSKMIGNLVSLLMEEAISMDDLDGFSDKLWERVKSLVGSYQGD